MYINKAKKIVLKIGSSNLVDKQGKLKEKWLKSLVTDIQKLRRKGKEFVIVSSGAIALGHPVGATGSIIMTKLIYELRRRNGKYGLATMCIGGGQGIAVIIEAIYN